LFLLNSRISVLLPGDRYGLERGGMSTD